ncbi:MAG: 5-deoxy-glucuronate isomerase [candidate division KSB1 bacterium]|nr:5-deoxy-glucuronate isomerase [candidate division KSB1 bacterium]MDZ7367628.1 5-deoxy-glucuronate isomerase [candidate division KSB1 bacterium]
MRFSEAAAVRLGSAEAASRRTIYKYIHPGGIPSCQLVMGFTQLESGAVWNTMPPHTHHRRMEVYLYFELPENAHVFHFMDRLDETRHLLLFYRSPALTAAVKNEIEAHGFTLKVIESIQVHEDIKLVRAPRDHFIANYLNGLWEALEKK